MKLLNILTIQNIATYPVIISKNWNNQGQNLVLSTFISFKSRFISIIIIDNVKVIKDDET